MSRAFQKNRAALARLLGNEALADRLLSTRIGVWSGANSATAAGRLLAEALGDTLGRLWQQIDVIGPLDEVFANALRVAAASAGYASDIQQRWQPPYDFVIAIGTEPPCGAGPAVRIGANGWVVYAGAGAAVGDDPNPVGPTLAAGCAGSEVFKVIFADALGDRDFEHLGDLAWSAWSYGADLSSPAPMPLQLGEMHVFGAGAVTHGMAWVLARWPDKVMGCAHLIDPDSFDESNAQRYAGMQDTDVGEPKAEALADRLGMRVKGVRFVPHPEDMNKYFGGLIDKSMTLAIAGLDSPEARRQLALKLPGRVVNMWTEGFHLGAARFGIGAGRSPCLFCAYPEPATTALDETAELYRQLSAARINILPGRIRELLDTSGPLSEQEVQGIARAFGIDAVGLVGKPLRSIRGILCATGKVKLGDNAADADVPLAHSSLLAGVFGFVELVHELCAFDMAPTRWRYSTLHPLRHGFLEPAGKRSDCYLCANDVTRQVNAQIWATAHV